jgi:hypothetical protein
VFDRGAPNKANPADAGLRHAFCVAKVAPHTCAADSRRYVFEPQRMKIGIFAILLILSLSAVVMNLRPVFTEQIITEGQRVYETMRETNADSRPIALNHDDGRSLIKFIESARIGECRSRFLLLAFSFLVFVGTAIVVAIEYREKAKRKHNLAASVDGL